MSYLDIAPGFHIVMLKLLNHPKKKTPSFASSSNDRVVQGVLGKSKLQEQTENRTHLKGCVNTVPNFRHSVSLIGFE